eukprot:TRINITY_DN101427_c0_g1_i1.p1 TRINITY_DN101427_c0_g1~~TRINITY_DN101427_c0_g1_i1.p1  ORF type:complete len:208 (-),score=49.71 TRINITY_DN101427_c0_g1_i1:124-747(-)
MTRLWFMSAVTGGLLGAALLESAQAQALGSENLVGEFGKPVSSCMCKGGKDTHGTCGYHFHFGSDEDRPWCRTKYGCGTYSMRGHWVYCNERGIERRRADDGKLYDALEFKKFFGKAGKDSWQKAAQDAERRHLKPTQKAYSVREFREYYIDELGEGGWVAKWEDALPETRQADDGKWYTFDNYVEHYGKDKAWHMWKKAKKQWDEL